MDDVMLESDELVSCLECGSTVDPRADRVFSITEEAILCYSCSLRRGGEYDGVRDKWSVAPRLDGLPGSVEHGAQRA